MRVSIGAALLAVTLAAAAGCGGKGSSTSSSTQRQGHGGATASSAPPPCATAKLRLLQAPGGVATGHTLSRYTVFNQDHERCTLNGFPKITLLDASDKPVALTVKPSTQDFFGTVAKRTVIVPIGGIASFRIADSSGPYVGIQKCATVARMRVSFPNAKGSKTLPTFGSPICPGGRTTVSPVAPGRGAYG